MANARDTVFRYVYQVTGDKDLANTASVLVKMADAGKLADEQSLALSASLKTLAGQSKAVNDALSQKAALAETAKRLTEAKDSAAALAKEFDRTDASSKRIVDAFKASDKAVADLTAQYNKQATELAKTQGALQKAGVDTNNLAKASESLNAQAAAVADRLAKVGTAAQNAAGKTSLIAASADKVRESFVHVSEGVGEFIRKAGEITGITGIITSVIAAISGFKFFEVGAEEAAHFDQALSKLKATTSLSAAEFDALKGRVEAAAIALDFTATEGVQSAARLAQSLGDANKAAEALPATLLLAKAAQIDAASAADIMATSLKAFGLQATDAAKIADTLAAVSVKTGVNLTALSETVAQLAPLAQSIGLTFEDTATVLGALAQRGIDSQQALGGLRALFEGLRDPTSVLRQQLVGLGIDTSSLSSIIEGLAKAGPDAETALDSLGNKGKAAILALVQDGGAGLKQFRQALGDTAGAAKDAGQKIGDNLLDSLNDFGVSLKNLAGGVLGDALAPLKEEVQSLTERIRGIPESAGFQRIKAAFTDFVASGVAAFDKLISSIDFEAVSAKVVEFVNGAKSGFDSLKQGLSSFGSTASAVANSIGFAFNAAQAIIFGAASAISKAVEIAGKGILVLSGQSAQLLDQNSQATRVLQAFGEAAEVNYKRAAAAAEAAAKNVDSLGGALDESANSADKAGAATEGAAGGMEQAGTAAENATPSIDAAAVATEGAAVANEKLTGAALAAAQAIAQAKYDEAAANLEKLRQSATASADDLDRAALAVSAAGLELEKLGPTADKAKSALDNLKAAFAGLKITSQADLQKAADAARNYFELIDKSSEQTAAGLADRRNAFLAYAKAAIDAASSLDQSTKDQVAAQLEARAASLDVLDALTKLEEQGFKTGKKIAEGFKEAKKAAEDAGTAIDDAGRAAKGAADGQQGYTKALQGTQAAMAGIVAIGPEQAAALKLLNERLSQSAQLTNLSLDEAKFLLSTLGPLAGGAAGLIERRIQELTEAASKAEAAASRMKGEAQDLQDQIDELLGNDLSIEDRRHAKKLADLEAEARANGTLNSAEYRQLVDLENKLHALKMANIRKEKGGGGPTGDNPQTGASGGSPEGPAPAPAPAPRPEGGGGGGGVSSGRGGVQVQINVHGSLIGTGTPKEIAEDLARLIRPELRRIDGRT